MWHDPSDILKKNIIYYNIIIPQSRNKNHNCLQFSKRKKQSDHLKRYRVANLGSLEFPHEKKEEKITKRKVAKVDARRCGGMKSIFHYTIINQTDVDSRVWVTAGHDSENLTGFHGDNYSTTYKEAQTTKRRGIILPAGSSVSVSV